MSNITLVECPRDAIQGLPYFIATKKKIDYIQDLINSNLFEWLDMGSFVSPKAVPQMSDTAEVIEALSLNDFTKLLVIVANVRGAEEAQKHSKVSYVGFPFSISATFQQKNTNSTIEQAYENVSKIYDLVGEKLVLYLSMAFGNPYGDAWHEDIVMEWLNKFQDLGIREISLADTTSMASSDLIGNVYFQVNKAFPNLNVGVHLHAHRTEGIAKIIAAFINGCRKFDGAILGFGGCPFAQDEMVGNMPSEHLLKYFNRASTEKISHLQSEFKKLIQI